MAGCPETPGRLARCPKFAATSRLFFKELSRRRAACHPPPRWHAGRQADPCPGLSLEPARASKRFHGRHQSLQDFPGPPTQMAPRPHRACLGGAGVSAPEGKRGAFPAPTELVSVERGLGDKKRTGGEPPRWCRSLRSTGASPVGARRWKQPLLVQKPLLHRGEPGGGGTRRALLAGAEADAPPGRARWGRGAIRASSTNGRQRAAGPGTAPAVAAARQSIGCAGPRSEQTLLIPTPYRAAIYRASTRRMIFWAVSGYRSVRRKKSLTTG